MKSQVYWIPANGKEEANSLSRKAETLYLKLGLHDKIEKESFVALKIHFGEKGNTGFIKAPWLEGLVHQLRKNTKRAFFTDTNTLYVGMRSNAIDYLTLAADHGYSLEKTGLPVFIADGLIGENDEEIKIGLGRVKAAKIGAGIVHADFLICLSHLTGHVQTGLGAAIKNLGMGCAARAGKLEQHSDVHPRVNSKHCTNCGICLEYCPADAIDQRDGSAFIIDDRCIGCGECLVVCKVGAIKMRWDENSARLQEKMAEYAFAVQSKFPGKIGYLNFLIKMTKDCDCMSKDQPDIVADIGIAASSDPVALDKASADLVVKTAGKDVLRAGYDLDWSLQLKHGQQIGLGSLDYDLIELK
ncbi:MAG: hypothetical protein A2W03_11170 [Candidatus Aminicenantes bacterium RBG_16_63_16]|nr:MAG: hypothetical protein A2W03_11170 [Candidatus Aminicenantes bacterium RBG_16_63_16]